MQLYAAGTETTASSLQWALFYMCKFPDEQRKVCEEIQAEIGKQESITRQAASKIMQWSMRLAQDR